MHRTKKKGRSRIEPARRVTRRMEFESALESLPGPPDARVAVYNAAMTNFGKKTSESADWFEAHSDVMVSVIEEKRNALADHKACPRERNLQVDRGTTGGP